MQLKIMLRILCLLLLLGFFYHEFNNKYVVSKEPSTLKVIQFGATVNDSSDDTLAIHNALNTAKEKSKSLKFMAGRYIISSNLSIPSNVSLLGSATKNTIIDGYSSSIDKILEIKLNSIQTKNSLSIKDFTFKNVALTLRSKSGDTILVENNIFLTVLRNLITY